MAMRDENHFFTRQIAERGSDEIVFDSQDRKIQETDPKDVIWDEIIGKEEHPEDGDSCNFQETDSDSFIRDENFGKEEYLENCSTLYLSPLRFDEYEDEEWYLWFHSHDCAYDEFHYSSPPVFDEYKDEDCSDIYLSYPCFDNYGDEMVNYKDY